MKKLALTFCLVLILFGSAQAQEDSTNSTESVCPGTWTLSNPSGWVITNETGMMLPLSASTVVLGCNKTPIPLEMDLVGASVDVECVPSSVANGLADIITISIVCK
jgi:hypothetical protein